MDLLGPDFSKASYWTEFDERGERLVMPLRRSWKAIGAALFGFGLWLGERSLRLLGHDHKRGWEDYLVVGLSGFVVVHLLINIATSLLAREVLRVEGSELIHGWTILGLRRETRYRLTEISGLSIDPAGSAEEAKQLLSPLSDFGKKGVVKFDYRGKMRGIGAALDEAHGEQVMAWIVRRIPRIPQGFWA